MSKMKKEPSAGIQGFSDSSLWNKTRLRAEYESLLEESQLDSDPRYWPKDVISQVSSGSEGEPLCIPRSKTDVADIYARILKQYKILEPQLPKTVVLIGGISHFQASQRLKIGGVSIISLEIEKIESLDEINPDVISCYPSVIRDIVASSSLQLSNLKMIKLGGERLFPADLEKISNRFPGVPVLEQYGSTEMPAIAFRLHRNSKVNHTYQLENGRFKFVIAENDGWQPVIVKDCFPDLMFNMKAFYDLGDEWLIENGQPVDIRRKNDTAWSERDIINQLLSLGAVNLQVHETARKIYYTGSVEISPEITLDDGKYETVPSDSLLRLPCSNKMPFFRPF